MVAAWRFGFPTDLVTIIPKGNEAGHHIGDSPAKHLNFGLSSSREVFEAAEKMAIVCYAGPAAQKRYDPLSWDDEHGKDDQGEASRLIDLLIPETEEKFEYMRVKIEEEMRRREQGFPPPVQYEDDKLLALREVRLKRMNAKQAELYERAETFIRKHWEEVEAVAKALLKHKELSGEAATRILETLTGEVTPRSRLFDYKNPNEAETLQESTEA